MATNTVSLNIILGLVNKARPGLQAMQTNLREIKTEVKAAADDMKASWGELAGVSQRVGMGMMAAGGMAVGAFVAAGKAAADYGSTIWDVSQATGVSTDALQELKFAAEQTGASLDSVKMGLRTVSRAAYDAIGGSKEQAEAFAALGLEIEDLRGKSPDELFYAVGAALRETEGPALRLALAQKTLGKSAMQLIPMFTDAEKSLADYAEEARNSGLIIQQDAIKAADDFGDTLDKLGTQAKVAFMAFGADAIPTLKKFANWMSGALSTVREFNAEHPKLSVGMAVAGAVIGALLVPLGGLLYILPGVVQGVALLRKFLTLASLDALAAKINIAAAGVAARVAGIQAAWAAGGFQGLAASISSVALPLAYLAGGVATIVGLFRFLRDLLDDIANHRAFAVITKLVRLMNPAGAAGEGIAGIVADKIVGKGAGKSEIEGGAAGATGPGSAAGTAAAAGFDPAAYQAEVEKATADAGAGVEAAGEEYAASIKASGEKARAAFAEETAALAGPGVPTPAAATATTPTAAPTSSGSLGRFYDAFASAITEARTRKRVPAITTAEGFSGTLTADLTHAKPAATPEEALRSAYSRYDMPGTGAPPVTPTGKAGEYYVESSPNGSRTRMQMTPQEALQRMLRLQEERDRARRAGAQTSNNTNVNMQITVNGSANATATAKAVGAEVDRRFRNMQGRYRATPAGAG